MSGKKAKQGAEAAYLYTVEWSEDDAVYIGRVAEFPSLAAHGDTPQSALDEVMSVVRDVLIDLRASSEPVPQPLAKARFGGKLDVELPASLHRRLSIEAARQGISLNQLINARLAANR